MLSVDQCHSVHMRICSYRPIQYALSIEMLPILE